MACDFHDFLHDGVMTFPDGAWWLDCRGLLVLADGSIK